MQVKKQGLVQARLGTAQRKSGIVRHPVTFMQVIPFSTNGLFLCLYGDGYVFAGNINSILEQLG